MDVDSGIRENSHERKWRELSPMQITLIRVITFFICIGFIYLFFVFNVAPRLHKQFSIVGVSASGLNVNATSSPVFHIIFRVDPTSASVSQACLIRISATISYSGDIMAAFHEPGPCYNMNYWNEFVVQVTGNDITLPKNLRESLVNRKEVKVDIEMEFRAAYLPSNYYHVWCKNVPIKDMDVPMSCSVTMKVNWV